MLHLEEVVRETSDLKNNFSIAKVDEEEEGNHELMDYFNIESLPTILIIYRGTKLGEYHGGYDSTSMIRYIRELLNASQVLQVQRKEKNNRIAFLSNEIKKLEISSVGIWVPRFRQSCHLQR